MRVSIDFVPRTSARDSILIKDHPDWFYWISLDSAKEFRTPHVEGLNNYTTPTKECAEQIYNSKYVLSFIDKFSDNPSIINPSLWKKVKNMNGNLLSNIEKHFNITTAPAFSDAINDPQPSWNDVTYLKMYFDNPISSKPYLNSKKVKPYVLFDVAKSSLNPGKVKNKELWDYISNVIPYYQQEFGIDCARIDMGHALPKELNKLLIKKAREIDPYFGFIAEEMFIGNSNEHKQLKYNAIVGNSFLMIHELDKYKIQEFSYSTRYSALPVFAASETHDTPRIASRPNGEKLNLFLSSACMFAPNAIPFLNCGQEINEITSINTGLGSNNIFDKAIISISCFITASIIFDKVLCIFIFVIEIEFIK